jgi:hypothetical protein
MKRGKSNQGLLCLHLIQNNYNQMLSDKKLFYSMIQTNIKDTGDHLIIKLSDINEGTG